MNLKKGVFSIFLLMVIMLSLAACNASDAAADLRAGEWNAANDFAEVTLTVNEEGTAITQVVVDYECESNGVSLSGLLNLGASGEGWPIKNGKFTIDFLDTSAQLNMTGRFNSQNNQVAGTFKIGACSGKWEAER